MIDFNDVFKDYAILDKEEVRKNIFTKSYPKERLDRMHVIYFIEGRAEMFGVGIDIDICTILKVLNSPDFYLIEYKGEDND